MQQGTVTRMREMFTDSNDLRRKIELMEKQYGEQFSIVFDAIRRLTDEKHHPESEIGFQSSFL